MEKSDSQINSQGPLVEQGTAQVAVSSHAFFAQKHQKKEEAKVILEPGPAKI